MIVLVPRGRIELPTSSLPMMRSTTELPRLFWEGLIPALHVRGSIWILDIFATAKCRAKDGLTLCAIVKLALNALAMTRVYELNR